jgi:neutral ceramidase
MSSGSGHGGLKVGLATADITPPVGATLVGYKPRVSTSVAHPLRAEAMACSDGASSWVLVVGDFLGLRLEETRRIRKRIASRTGLPAGAIAVAGTHTHSGPATVLAGSDPSEIDVGYREVFRKSLADVAVRAFHDLQPASLRWVATEARELGSNRRVEREGGKWENEWRDPEGRHPGFFDPTLLALSVHRSDGSRRAIVTNYGVHPVVLGPESLAISPDYAGYAKRELEERELAGTAVFLLSGAGNINPRVCIETDQARAKEMARRFADAVAAALGRSEAAAGTPVRASSVQWRIRRTRDAYKGPGGPGSRAGDLVRTELQAFRAGDVALVTVPGELFSEIAGELRKLSPCSRTLVVTLANDYIGYLPTNRAQQEGAYETLMAPAVGVEDMILSRARELFERIAGGAR